MVEDNINVIVIHSKKYLSQYVLSYKKIFLISTIVYTFFQPTQSGAIRAQTTKVPKKIVMNYNLFFFNVSWGNDDRIIFKSPLGRYFFGVCSKRVVNPFGTNVKLDQALHFFFFCFLVGGQKNKKIQKGELLPFELKSLKFISRCYES